MLVHFHYATLHVHILYVCFSLAPRAAAPAFCPKYGIKIQYPYISLSARIWSSEKGHGKWFVFSIMKAFLTTSCIISLFCDISSHSFLKIKAMHSHFAGSLVLIIHWQMVHQIVHTSVYSIKGEEKGWKCRSQNS